MSCPVSTRKPRSRVPRLGLGTELAEASSPSTKTPLASPPPSPHAARGRNAAAAAASFLDLRALGLPSALRGWGGPRLLRHTALALATGSAQARPCWPGSRRPLRRCSVKGLGGTGTAAGLLQGRGRLGSAALGIWPHARSTTLARPSLCRHLGGPWHSRGRGSAGPT